MLSYMSDHVYKCTQTEWVKPVTAESMNKFVQSESPHESMILVGRTQYGGPDLRAFL